MSDNLFEHLKHSEEVDRGSNDSESKLNDSKYAGEDKPSVQNYSNLHITKLPSINNPSNTFPAQLYYMLDEVEDDGHDHIISWQPHGRCLLVHKRKEFEQELLPFWFNQTKYSSFQRQLNLYNFHRITKGPDKGGYYHELFLRSKPNLCHHIHRQKTKGNGPRRPSGPENEPNFYELPPLSSSKGPCEKDCQQPLTKFPTDSEIKLYRDSRSIGNRIKVPLTDMLLQVRSNKAAQYAALQGLVTTLRDLQAANLQSANLQWLLLSLGQEFCHARNPIDASLMLAQMLAVESPIPGLVLALMSQLRSMGGSNE